MEESAAFHPHEIATNGTGESAAFPGAIGLFTKLDSPITLSFLRRFPTAAKAAWLSPKRMAGWLHSVGYNGGIATEVLHRRLVAAAPGLAGIEGEARGQITLGLAAAIEALNAQITAVESHLAELLASHPDQHICDTRRSCRSEEKRHTSLPVLEHPLPRYATHGQTNAPSATPLKFLEKPCP